MVHQFGSDSMFQSPILVVRLHFCLHLDHNVWTRIQSHTYPLSGLFVYCKIKERPEHYLYTTVITGLCLYVVRTQYRYKVSNNRVAYTLQVEQGDYVILQWRPVVRHRLFSQAPVFISVCFSLCLCFTYLSCLTAMCSGVFLFYL